MKEFRAETLEIFRGLDKRTLDYLENKGEIGSYKRGEFLFFDKDRVEDIYFIVSGKISMYKCTRNAQKRVIYILGDGEFINEVIFDSLPASINAEVFEDSTLIRYNVEEFKKIMATDFELAHRIINSLGRKVRRLYRQIKNTVPISLDKKVAAKLWKLSKDYGTACGGGGSRCMKYTEECSPWTRIDLKITITYLANMLGSSRETISREMKKLERENLIKWEGKSLLVKKEELSDFFRKD